MRIARYGYHTAGLVACGAISRYSCLLSRPHPLAAQLLRGELSGLTGPHCDVFHLDHEQKVIALHRWQDGGAGDSVVVVANFTNQVLQDYLIRFPATGIWQVRLNSDSVVYGQDFSECRARQVDVAQAEAGEPAPTPVTVGPYSVLILFTESVKTARCTVRATVADHNSAIANPFRSKLMNSIDSALKNVRLSGS